VCLYRMAECFQERRSVSDQVVNVTREVGELEVAHEERGKRKFERGLQLRTYHLRPFVCADSLALSPAPPSHSPSTQFKHGWQEEQAHEHGPVRRKQ
jgi:hypothetical protein